MTNTELIVKIKAEIKKLQTFYGELHTDFVCEKLLSFLSKLESEKPINQEGLEEEIKWYYDDCDGDCRYAQTARHFAQWGAEHLKK